MSRQEPPGPSARPGPRPRRAPISVGIGALFVVGLLMALSPASATAASGTITIKAPYHAGQLPTSSVTIYGCNAKAKIAKPFHFDHRTGLATGALSASARACPQIPYRLGSQSEAQDSAAEEISILVKFPTGTRNLTEHLTVTYSAAIRETNGTSGGACPSTPFGSNSSSYYNGTAWSYSPSISHPLVFTNSTYFYYYNSYGASGGCQSYAEVNGGFTAFMVAENGLAGFGLNGGTNGGASWSFGGTVGTYASVDWSCYNYTLWYYGGWYNSSGTCYNGNVTAYTTSYDDMTNSYGTNSTMTFSGTASFSMWYSSDFRATDAQWAVFFDPYGSVNAITGGFPHGTANAVLNLGSGGAGVDLKSITIT